MRPEVVVINPLAERLGHYEDETLGTQYAGKDYDFPPGSQTKLIGAMAGHILNILAPRGLSTLVFGDDKDDIKKVILDGQRRNIEWKRQQVIKWNTVNMTQKGQNLKIIPPSKLIQKYSRDVKIPLAGGYEAGDSENMRQMMDMETKLATERKEKEELQDQMIEVMKQMKELKAMISGSGKKAEEKGDEIRVIEDPTPQKEESSAERLEDIDLGGEKTTEETAANPSDVINSFKRLGGKGLGTWVENNKASAESWPPGVMEALEEKWEKVRTDEFPLRKASA